MGTHSHTTQRRLNADSAPRPRQVLRSTIAAINVSCNFHANARNLGSPSRVGHMHLIIVHLFARGFHPLTFLFSKAQSRTVKGRSQLVVSRELLISLSRCVAVAGIACTCAR